MPEQVTVVVATRNRRADLLRTLPRHEAPVVIVDNGSTDGTAEAVRRVHPAVTVVRLGTNRGSIARNAGVALATTPYVAFADDDSWWTPGALRRAAEILAVHPRLGLLAARISVGPQEAADPTNETMACSPLGIDSDLPGPSVLGFVACGAVVRREAFLQVGGFHDVVRFPGEEATLALDLAVAGWKLAYVAEIVAHHHPSAVRQPADDRAAQIVRSRLLTALLRRPWPVVRGEFAAAVRSGHIGRRGTLATVDRLPSALWQRRAIPPWLEADVRLLAQAGAP